MAKKNLCKCGLLKGHPGPCGKPEDSRNKKYLLFLEDSKKNKK